MNLVAPEREREVQGLLLGIVALNLAPHAFDTPPWIVAISAAFLVWKALFLYRGFALPSALFANTLAGFAALGVFIQYGTVLGQEPASALLLLVASLKTLDTKGYRDAMLVILISYFLLMTHLLASQSLPSTLFMAADVFLITTLMFHAHKRDRRSSLRSFRPIMRLLFFATPLWIFLFFAFPRFGAGLLPGSERPASDVGFSDELSPGGIGRLVERDVPAFRVVFTERGGQKTNKPGIEDMYWRGAVLGESLGLSWGRGSSKASFRPNRDEPDGSIGYEITLEAGFKKHLFVLDSPRTVEFDDSIKQDQMRRFDDNTFALLRDADARFIYRATSSKLPAQVHEVNLNRWLQVPADLDPLTIELAHQITDGSVTEKEKSERIQSWFSQNGFAYTHSPGRMKTGTLREFLFETKRGFCEHFAGAFATLMRLAGVPTRVVIGFLGGKPNEFGSYLLVRGLDAHAWAEFYRKDLDRWERADPTVWIAPLRATLGGDFNSVDQSWLQAGLTDEQIRSRLPWLDRQFQRAEMAWDASTAAWTGFLLRYDFDYQNQILQTFGLAAASRLVFLVWLGVGAFGIGAALYGFMRWRTKREDPFLMSWRELGRALEPIDLERGENEGPIHFAERIRARRASSSVDAAQLLERAESLALQFADLRYGRTDSGRDVRKRFRLAVIKLTKDLRRSVSPYTKPRMRDRA